SRVKSRRGICVSEDAAEGCRSGEAGIQAIAAETQTRSKETAQSGVEKTQAGKAHAAAGGGDAAGARHGRSASRDSADKGEVRRECGCRVPVEFPEAS